MKRIILPAVLSLASAVLFAGPVREKNLFNNSWTAVSDGDTVGIVSLPKKIDFSSELIYIKTFDIPESESGRFVGIEFEGLGRDAEVYCNGILVGRQDDAHLSQIYDLKDYIAYGGSNEIKVCTSSEPGIFRNVYLHKHNLESVDYNGIRTYIEENLNTRESSVNGYLDRWIDGTAAVVPQTAHLVVETDLLDRNLELPASCQVLNFLYDRDGILVASGQPVRVDFDRFRKASVKDVLSVECPHLWNLADPYLYTLKTVVLIGSEVTDEIETKVGLRTLFTDPVRGFFLNGERTELKGVNLFDDHAGTGCYIPDALMEYRLSRLKGIGVNAIRTTFSPASPSLLDLCDRMGILVIDEAAEAGTSELVLSRFGKMISRDFNHPSVIMWSLGDEYWNGAENVNRNMISRTMAEYAHILDPSRNVTSGSRNGSALLDGDDVLGYDYLVESPIENNHIVHPELAVVGMAEQTGAGVRGSVDTETRLGVEDRPMGGDEHLMLPVDRNSKGQVLNVIERGWKYYYDRPWALGVFFWTGFDYNENGSLSTCGLFDYYGNPKDEAYYLKACWTDEPVLYASPAWGQDMKKGQKTDLWVYSNCNSVKLQIGGRNMGRKTMQKNGHLVWNLTYTGGDLVLTGYHRILKNASLEMKDNPKPMNYRLTASRRTISSDGQDVVVIDVTLVDNKGNEIKVAENPFSFKATPNVEVLSSMDSLVAGRAQFILRSVEGSIGTVTLTVEGSDGLYGSVDLTYVD